MFVMGQYIQKRALWGQPQCWLPVKYARAARGVYVVHLCTSESNKSQLCLHHAAGSRRLISYICTVGWATGRASGV